jgi:hypothetical protein
VSAAISVLAAQALIPLPTLQGPLIAANVHLFILLQGLMLIELLSASVLADRMGVRWEKADWKKAIIDDFLSMGLVGIAVLMDFGIQHVPSSAGFALSRDLLESNLITKFCIIALILAEGRDAYQNIARARGKGIGPLDYIFRMGERDKREWEDKHGNLPKPKRRDVDKEPVKVAQELVELPLSRIRERRDGLPTRREVDKDSTTDE